MKKKRSSKHRNLLTFCLFAGLSIAVALFMYSRSENRLEKQLIATVNGYLRFVPTNDVWWLDTTPAFSETASKFFETKRSEILAVLEKYRMVNNFTARICDHAKGMPFAAVSSRELGKANTFVAGGGFLVAAVPRDAALPTAQFLKKGTLLYCSPENNCLFFPALSMSESFFASVFMHEYGHGIRAMVDKNVGNDTDEEVLMHELSQDILIYRTPLYKEKITSIASRDSPQSFKQALGRLTADDLRELDILVHGTNYSRTVAQYSVTEHLYAVCFSFVETRSLPRSTKAEAYVWVSRLSGNPGR